MPSRKWNKEVKMASNTESCTGESDDEVYVEAERKLTVGLISCQNRKLKRLCGSILVLKLIEMAVLFVSIYQSVACARTTQQLQRKIQIHQICTAT